ncbi:MAG: hypothetical protein MZW92_71315 [Comamonadaceae bacterium]|nr:hypothetical protein [Comamonadaceae bacterium]
MFANPNQFEILPHAIGHHSIIGVLLREYLSVIHITLMFREVAGKLKATARFLSRRYMNLRGLVADSIQTQGYGSISKSLRKRFPVRGDLRDVFYKAACHDIITERPAFRHPTLLGSAMHEPYPEDTVKRNQSRDERQRVTIEAVA